MTLSPVAQSTRPVAHDGGGDDALAGRTIPRPVAHDGAEMTLSMVTQTLYLPSPQRLDLAASALRAHRAHHRPTGDNGSIPRLVRLRKPVPGE